MTKAISPKIRESAAEFYPDLFRNLNAGATHTLEAFPVLYRRTLHEMRGRFSEGELSLMIDVFNGTWLTPDLAGQHLGVQCSDGIALDGLDEKWGVEKDGFLDRVRTLTVFQAACLELWAVGFWATLPDGVGGQENFDRWMKPLLDEGGEE